MTGDEWTPDEKRRLAEEFQRGGRVAARAAFPGRTRYAVYCAIDRHLLGKRTRPRPQGDPAPIDPTALRQRMHDLSLDSLADGLDDLVNGREGRSS